MDDLDQLDDDGRAYVAKLHRSKHPAAVIVAFVLLLLALRRQVAAGYVSLFAVTSETRVATAMTVLGVAVARYVARQTGTAPADTALVAGELRGAVGLAIAKAAQTLSGAALLARVTLITQAEMQLLTARLTQRAAAGAGRAIIRETHGANPCDACSALAGRYTAPYPVDLYWTHPRCACTWRVEGSMP